RGPRGALLDDDDRQDRAAGVGGLVIRPSGGLGSRLETRSMSRAALIAMALSTLAAGAARAADEEIQVYMDEIGPVHRPGLDVHLNYVPDGRTRPDYPAQEA